MKVYYGNPRWCGTIFVQPGREHPENSDWWHGIKTPDGVKREPIMFTVRFQNGEATVDKELGRFLIDQKMALASPASRLVLPQTVAR